MSLRENVSRAARRLRTRWTATFATTRTTIRLATSPPSATSSPMPPTKTARNHSTFGRSCVRWSTRTILSWSGGPTWPTPTPPWCSTRTSPEFRCASSASNRGSSPARGGCPADGPDQWTSGTLFPQSSKKTARAINAASGNRPLVVLANLSGFDGSPESLRNIQLENGAEIGRAIVNFDGPIVFCVISRYHGGAFVVFSNALNDNMEVLAVEGSFSSVIGGAPAAAVVFTRDVNRRTGADPIVRG